MVASIAYGGAASTSCCVNGDPAEMNRSRKSSLLRDGCLLVLKATAGNVVGRMWEYAFKTLRGFRSQNMKANFPRSAVKHPRKPFTGKGRKGGFKLAAAKVWIPLGSEGTLGCLFQLQLSVLRKVRLNMSFETGGKSGLLHGPPCLGFRNKQQA